MDDANSQDLHNLPAPVGEEHLSAVRHMRQRPRNRVPHVGGKGEKTNPSTGHLIALGEGIRRLDPGYVSVPANLERAARIKLAGSNEAYVSLTSGGKLSRFAAEQRRAESQKNKNRKSNRSARAARKRNRA